ncbi:unnamed protein product, partial [Oppiella nova]
MCGGVGCSANSLPSLLIDASKHSNVSYISNTAPNSWVDDYNSWGDNSTRCCRLHNSNVSDFCESTNSNPDCTHCQIYNTTYSIVKTEEFYEPYLKYFLSDLPNAQCSKAGGPSYGPYVHLDYSHDTKLPIKASSFNTYHTVLKNSHDFISALKNARILADSMTEGINSDNKGDDPRVEVYPYSIFYVFYEQYLTIWKDTVVNLVIALSAIFVVTFIF